MGSFHGLRTQAAAHAAGGRPLDAYTLAAQGNRVNMAALHARGGIAKAADVVEDVVSDTALARAAKAAAIAAAPAAATAAIIAGQRDAGEAIEESNRSDREREELAEQERIRARRIAKDGE